LVTLYGVRDYAILWVGGIVFMPLTLRFRQWARTRRNDQS